MPLTYTQAEFRRDPRAGAAHAGHAGPGERGGGEMALGMARALLDLIFPPRCVGCGATGAAFCGACAGKVRQPPAPRCARCDSPLASAPPDGLCRPCASGAFAPALDRVTVAALYEEPLRAAIHALKYQRRRRMASGDDNMQ